MWVGELVFLAVSISQKPFVHNLPKNFVVCGCRRALIYWTQWRRVATVAASAGKSASIAASYCMAASCLVETSGTKTRRVLHARGAGAEYVIQHCVVDKRSQ